MVEGRHFENRYTRYIHNCLTDFDEISKTITYAYYLICIIKLQIIIKTGVSFCCKSHRYITTKIGISSRNSKHRTKLLHVWQANDWYKI